VPFSCAHTQAAEADALLSKYTPKAGSSTSPIDAARPTLLRAQLALEAGNVGTALSLMQQGLPEELRMKPAVLATRVALMEQVGLGWLGGDWGGGRACKRPVVSVDD
jgi:hypothetical protein